MVRLTRSDRRFDVAPLVRLGCGAGVGLVLGYTITWPSAVSAVLAGWAATAAVFVAWTWLVIGPMGAEETRAHATREEPTRPGSEIMLVAAAVLSLGGVAGIVFGGQSHDALPMIATLAAVLTSWAAIHTVFALRYARLYLVDDHGGSTSTSPSRRGTATSPTWRSPSG